MGYPYDEITMNEEEAEFEDQYQAYENYNQEEQEYDEQDYANEEYYQEEEYK